MSTKLKRRPKGLRLLGTLGEILDGLSFRYAPSYMYPGNSYPNYLSGTSYLMSIDVVPKLYKAAHEVPIFHLEDVYITGIIFDNTL